MREKETFMGEGLVGWKEQGMGKWDEGIKGGGGNTKRIHQIMFSPEASLFLKDLLREIVYWLNMRKVKV